MENNNSLEKLVKIGCVHAILVERIQKKMFGEFMTFAEIFSRDNIQCKAIKSVMSQAFTRTFRGINEDLKSLPEVELSIKQKNNLKESEVKN